MSTLILASPRVNKLAELEREYSCLPPRLDQNRADTNVRAPENPQKRTT